MEEGEVVGEVEGRAGDEEGKAGEEGKKVGEGKADSVGKKDGMRARRRGRCPITGLEVAPGELRRVLV